jgi:hypothetical protein
MSSTTVHSEVVSPLLGYLLTRSVGLPGDSGDIGNWLDSPGARLDVRGGRRAQPEPRRLGMGRRWMQRLATERRAAVRAHDFLAAVSGTYSVADPYPAGTIR